MEYFLQAVLTSYERWKGNCCLTRVFVPLVYVIWYLFEFLFLFISREQHQNLKDENEMLKVENLNITKVAKLMTNSMKESMDTSKR